MPDPDFLDELIDERTARNPDFPQMVDAAARRRAVLGALAERRREGDLSLRPTFSEGVKDQGVPFAAEFLAALEVTTDLPQAG